VITGESIQDRANEAYDKALDEALVEYRDQVIAEVLDLLAQLETNAPTQDYVRVLRHAAQRIYLMKSDAL
jgi:hypothetical protein